MVGIMNRNQDTAVSSTAGQRAGDPASGPAVELSAAAAYLELYASRPGLKAAVEASIRNDEPVAATRRLADAFIAALGVPGADTETTADLEGCMQVLLMWLKECNMQTDLVASVAKDLSSDTSSAELRLRFIALMYNAVSEDQGTLRYGLLLDIIQLASSAKMVSKIVDTMLPSIDRYLKQWAVTVDDKRKMYKVCYDALRSAGLIDKAFGLNVKQLELYNGADDGLLKSVEDDVVQAIVDAVRLPKLYRFDTLLELSAVKRLGTLEASAGNSNLRSLFELLSIFVKDDLDSFQEFSSKHEVFLTDMNIDGDAAADKMRLLTFASLGIESQDLSYDSIATALKIDNSEVEDWVIRAISSGLVDAKINQLRSSVAVYRSTQRMFTREEWQPLSERINIWKENIGDLLTALRETRHSSVNAAAEALSG